MISMACSQTRIFRIFSIIRGSTDCEISPETCCHVSGCQVRQDGDQQPGAGLTLSGSLCTFSMYDRKVLKGWRLLSLWFWILLNELNKLLPKSYALSNTSSESKAGKKCTTSAVSAVIAAERRVMVTFWWWLDDTMTIIAAALQQHCMTACSSFMFTQQPLQIPATTKHWVVSWILSVLNL